jgi:hypothetical protein
MSSNSKGRLARFFTAMPVTIAILCTFSAVAAAQEQPAPKWELYGGYSSSIPAGMCTANFQEHCSR